MEGGREEAVEGGVIDERDDELVRAINEPE